jgi:hypothetical protein
VPHVTAVGNVALVLFPQWMVVSSTGSGDVIKGASEVTGWTGCPSQHSWCSHTSAWHSMVAAPATWRWSGWQTTDAQWTTSDAAVVKGTAESEPAESEHIPQLCRHTSPLLPHKL